MSEKYTRTQDEISTGYVIGSHLTGPEHTADFYAAEFDRFIAKVKADALREAAYEFAEGAWSDEFLGDRVEDDVSAVQCMYRWFSRRADRIEADDE